MVGQPVKATLSKSELCLNKIKLSLHIKFVLLVVLIRFGKIYFHFFIFFIFYFFLEYFFGGYNQKFILF